MQSLAINEHGHVGGALDSPLGFRVAVLWRNGEVVILPTLFPGQSASASDINDRGEIVGWIRVSPGLIAPVLWAPHDDVTPPTLLLPATLVVDGTSPAGATVTYSVSASDDVDPNPVICSRPSGSVFPLLVTTVTCTATDAAGNSVSGTFDVIVKDAHQQLRDAISLVVSWNLRKLGTSLPDKLQIAQTAGATSQACETLNSLLNQVRAQTGKGLTVDQATELTTRAIRIQHVIGC